MAAKRTVRETEEETARPTRTKTAQGYHGCGLGCKCFGCGTQIRVAQLEYGVSVTVLSPKIAYRGTYKRSNIVSEVDLGAPSAMFFANLWTYLEAKCVALPFASREDFVEALVRHHITQAFGAESVLCPVMCVVLDHSSMIRLANIVVRLTDNYDNPRTLYELEVRFNQHVPDKCTSRFHVHPQGAGILELIFTYVTSKIYRHTPGRYCYGRDWRAFGKALEEYSRTQDDDFLARSLRLIYLEPLAVELKQ